MSLQTTAIFIKNGNDDNLSDLIGSIEYDKNDKISYNFRYDVNDDYLKKQNVNLKSDLSYGSVNISYLDENSKTNNIVTKDTETINYSFLSKNSQNFPKYSFQDCTILKKK